MMKYTQSKDSLKNVRSENPFSLNWMNLVLLLTSAFLVLVQCTKDSKSPSDSEQVLHKNTKAPGPEVILNQRFHPILLKDGRLMGLFVESLGDDRHVIKSIISEDHGHSWGEPQIMNELPKASENNAWIDLVPVLDRDNRIQVFLLKWREKDTPERQLDVWHTRTEHPWDNWEEPKRVYAGYVGALMSAIQMENGRLLSTFAFLTDRNRRTPDKGLAGYIYLGQHSSTTIYSDDDGKTFQQSPDTLSLPASTLRTYGGVEPVVIELKDGRVWMLIRTQMGRSYESYSTDGIRWTQPSPSRFTSSDSPTSLTRLKDGQIVMLWNACQRYPYAFGGRHVLHGAVSSDEGRTWQGFREVYRDPHRKGPAHPIQGDYGTAYSFCAPTDDGKMVFTTGQGPSAKTFLLDPKWLATKSQTENFTNGLEAWSVFGTQGVNLEDHPQKVNSQILRVQRTDEEFPAGAVWNFSGGKVGEVGMRIMLEKESGGFSITLTDHFSTPFDQEADIHGLFVVPINTEEPVTEAVKPVTEAVKLEPGDWYDFKLVWDFKSNQGQIVIDGEGIKTIPQLRIISQGVNYLRIRSLEDLPQQGGLLVESVYSKIQNQ